MAIREVQYKFLKKIKEQSIANRNDGKSTEAYFNREKIKFSQLENICEEFPDLYPAEPYKTDTDMGEALRVVYMNETFLPKAGVLEYIEYHQPRKYSLNNKGLSAIEEFENSRRDYDLQERVAAATEQTSKAAEKVAFEIRNQNSLHKNLLRDINCSLEQINSAEHLQKGSLTNIAEEVKNLVIVTENNIASLEQLGRIKERAHEKVRKNNLLFTIATLVLLILSILIGVLLVFRYKGQEHPIAWELIFVILPMVIDAALSIFKQSLIKDEEYYIKKFSAGNPPGHQK